MDLENTPHNGKKASIFTNSKLTKIQFINLLEKIKRYHPSTSALVYINNIYNNFILFPRWKELDKVVKLFYVFKLAEEENFFCFTSRLSLDFCHILRKEKKPEDFIRRRLNAILKTKFGKIPLYCFCIEDLNHFAHLHGIIESNLDIPTLKHCFKRTFFGKNYRNNSINNFSIHLQLITSSSRWLAYILKRNSFTEKIFPIYLSQELNKKTHQKYQQIKKLML